MNRKEGLDHGLIEKAAQLLTRAEAGGSRAFVAWVAHNREHVREVLEIAAIAAQLRHVPPEAWEKMRQNAQKRGTNVVPLRVDRSQRGTHRAFTLHVIRSPLRAGLFLAGVAAVGIAMAVGLRSLGTVYETAPGESRIFVLADGSRLHLNSETRVRARFRGKRRDLELAKGEAMLDVVHDTTRPFHITARGAVAQALGTQFDVRLDGGNLVVTVKEGRVRLLADDQAGSHAGGVEINRSESASVDVGGARRFINLHKLSELESRQRLAWTGWVELSATPLREAVAKFNRANTTQIVIDDPTLSDVRLGGVMSVIDPVSFVKALRNVGVTAVDARVGESSVFHLARAPASVPTDGQTQSRINEGRS